LKEAKIHQGLQCQKKKKKKKKKKKVQLEDTYLTNRV
jgi:hypothetical protein